MPRRPRRESGRGASSDKQLLKLSLAERTIADTHAQKVWPSYSLHNENAGCATA